MPENSQKRRHWMYILVITLLLAGGALTVATIAALLNQTVKEGVVMTGTINEDGTIGSVGGVLKKAKAAKEIGAIVVLVPKGQSTEINSIPEETFKDVIGLIYCETKYTKEVKYISKQLMKKSPMMRIFFWVNSKWIRNS